MAAQELKIFEKGFIAADNFMNRQYLDLFSNADIIVCNEPEISNIRVIKVNKIVINNNKDIITELSNVYNALYNLRISVSVIVKGSQLGVELYIAVQSNDMPTLAGNLLESSLSSNLPGIQLDSLNKSDTNYLIQNMGKSKDGRSFTKALASVSLIPTIRDNDGAFSQGLERFIDTMHGRNYLAVFLSVPLNDEVVEKRRRGYEEIYSTLSPHAKFTYTYGENMSHAVSKGISSSFSKSVNHSISNSNSSSTSSTFGESSGSSDGSGFGGDGWNFNSGSSYSTSSSYTSGNSFSQSISDSLGESHGSVSSDTDTDTVGSSQNKTINFENKSIENLMGQIEEQLSRINMWESYGLWENCAYFFSNDVSTSVLAATTYKSLMIGDNSGIEKAHVNIWQSATQYENIEKILNSVKGLNHPTATISGSSLYNKQMVTPTSLVSGKELALLQGMPCKSVLGVSVQEMAEFGRTVVYENKLPKKCISIGNAYYMGVENLISPVNMDLDMFSSHCFITGSSGSGKSYATYNLIDRLLENGVKILVIEPAKGEYRHIFGGLKRLNIFSVAIGEDRFLRINPFVFPDNIHILAHIEQLMQIFSAAWPLSAAMPSVLKSAIIKAYINMGWDINKSVWIKGYSRKKYPNFYDLQSTLPGIINSSEFSKEVKGNYNGALLMRVRGMTSGINDLIFNKTDGISSEELFDSNTIIDLSELGAEESISLIMGMLIVKLNEYRKYQRKKGLIQLHDASIKHITILEEAHNILKRTNKGQSMEGANMVGKSVEMISNSIKEMRTYGEGFIIVDQSPLAVDSSAIENSATKIIMNTPSREACQELGSALSLDEEQTRELSRLNVGVAAIMQKGWMMPVLTHIDMWDYSKYMKSQDDKFVASDLFIRGEMVRVLIDQIKQQRFLISELSSVIRQSSLSKSRKKELNEIVNIYKKYIEENVTLNEVMLGHLFMEICDCYGLYDVIPIDNLKSTYIHCENINKLEVKNDRIKYKEKMHNDSQLWINRFKKSLTQYIDIDEDDKYYVARYTIAYKCNSGKDLSSIFRQVYVSINNGKVR